MMLAQVFRFAVVGGITTATHFALVVALVETGLARPLAANCLSYGVSFFVSYFGHQMWTFKRKRSFVNQGPKFLAAVFIGFVVNQALFYLAHMRAHIDYRISVILAVVIVAVITFLLNKFWVFRTERSGAPD